MHRASASNSRLQTLEVPLDADSKIAALGPADNQSKFVAYIAGSGFRCLDLISEAGSWTSTIAFDGTINGLLGLHVHPVGGDDRSLHVSLVEASSQTWVCLLLQANRSKAETIERTSLPAQVMAACSSPDDEVAVVALANGSVRFLGLADGKVVGKGLKLTPAPAGAVVALARLKPKRVALIRDAPGSTEPAEFFIVALEEDPQRAQLHVSGSLNLPGLSLRGPLLGAAVQSEAEDRLLLCWGPEESRAATATGHSFAVGSLDQENPTMQPVPVQSSASARCWLYAAGYIFEGSAQVQDGDGLKLTVRDARFGLAVASLDVPFSAGSRRCPPMLVSSTGTVALITDGAGCTAAVRWTLPKFSLQQLVGCEATPQKRPRSDTEGDEMSRTKRLAATDRTLAMDIQARSMVPSPELVDDISRRGCWEAAAALLRLPELDEDLSISLLSARPQLLPQVVQRAHSSQFLDKALRDHLPATQLKEVLEQLLLWVQAYNEFSEDEIRKEAPSIPELPAIVAFLGSLVDGCLPALVLLEGDLVEQMLEALAKTKSNVFRTTKLYTLVREACRIQKPLRPLGMPPAIEVTVLDF